MSCRIGLRAVAIVLLALATTPAVADDLVFLSTQLRPVDSAQKTRTILLKGAPAPVAFVTEETSTLAVHVKAEQSGGATISLIGALHGELQPLAALGLLRPLDDLASRLAARGMPGHLRNPARLDGTHTLYIPWMQATYIMVANRKALPFLPPGADLNSLSYAQLAAWAEAIREKTGTRRLGFPAGPTGLMPRFFEGYLYPSFTGGVVSTFRTPDAEAMWSEFATIWRSVNPSSTSYGFMQEPLLTGDVWIAFDHVARLLDALRTHPDDFVAFPAPAGPRGRFYMPVVAGLAIPTSAPDPAGAAALIDYLTSPAVQIATLREVGFFPVTSVELPHDLDAGVRMEADAVMRMESSPDARPAALPVGLGQQGGAFDKVFMNTFQRIVLRGEAPRVALDREAVELQRVLDTAGAGCWSPDPQSVGVCKVR